jgi:hypothetical protein
MPHRGELEGVVTMKLCSLTQLRRSAVLGLGLLILAAVFSPVAADWLVTREGGRVETKGAWTVKGKLVVFHTAEGKLSSLRLADVDLDASQRATEEAVAAQAQAAAEPDKPAERRKSVRVITDKDVKPAPPPAEPAADAEEEPTRENATAATGSGLAVETWSQERDPDDDHVLINGTLKNNSNVTSAELKLKALIFDETGSLIATSQAALAATALQPGEKVAFRAEFPGYFSFATVKFEAQSRRLKLQPADQTAPSSPPDGGGTEN